MPDLDTPAETRDFLRLCLNPHRRGPRTPAQLAEIMPDWLREQLHTHAPRLADLKAAADRQEQGAARARADYVQAMKAWIDDTAPDPDEAPGTIVSITRYTVSVLPADDINHKYFAVHVELKPRGWIVHDGHQYYGPNGTTEFSESTAHRFADYDDALALAKETAPHLNLNGHTAVDAYHRTHPAGPPA